jgi:hypothetical protein
VCVVFSRVQLFLFFRFLRLRRGRGCARVQACWSLLASVVARGGVVMEEGGSEARVVSTRSTSPSVRPSWQPKFWKAWCCDPLLENIY